MAEKNKGGRPRIEIDEQQFEQLCALQCTLPEFAGWFRCSEDKIEMWCKEHYGMRFSEVFALKKGTGVVSVRRSLYQAAMKGNITAMIFWLKNHGGMADQIHVETKDITDDTVREMEAFFADQRAGYNSDKGQPGGSGALDGVPGSDGTA